MLGGPRFDTLYANAAMGLALVLAILWIFVGFRNGMMAALGEGLRFAEAPASVAAQQAILAWSQPGEIIGLALRPHSDTVRIEDAHRTLSTGVIAHTVHPA